MLHRGVIRAFLVVFAVSCLLTLGAGAVFAQSQWDKDHPRREEVNGRLENQNKRINEEVKEGKMSEKKAHKLKKADRQIRQEERDMARQNGGHITKQEQKTLNQQENAVSRRIGQ